jgi:hypothetical protein
MKLLPKISPYRREQRQTDFYRQQLRREAKIGGQLFGPIPTGHRREFFCLDRHTWVWHEEWVDKAGRSRAVTTRYDIRPQGVLKSQGNNSYQQVSGLELHNLHQAAELYYRNLVTQRAALQSAQV